MIRGHTPPFDNVDLDTDNMSYNGKPQDTLIPTCPAKADRTLMQPLTLPPYAPPIRHPSTYLHAVAGKGWPYDHKAEDTFEVPTHTPETIWPEERIKEMVRLKIEAAKLDHAQKLCDGPVYVIPGPLKYEHNGPDIEYFAEYTPSGGVALFLVTKKTIASFDTFADAQTAAEALNNHKGY